MSGRDVTGEVDRFRLAARLDDAVAAMTPEPPTPTVVVDLDGFDRNAADLVRRAGGKPIRVASKSLRVPALVERALSHPGFSGVLAYSLREALWLAGSGLCDDVLMGYPSVDRTALARLASDQELTARVTLMVDAVEHLDLADAVRPAGGPAVRVALDVDAGLVAGPAHVGPLRSPLKDAASVVALAKEVLRRPGFDLVGVMTYEGQVAGVPDTVPGQRGRSWAVRRIKNASVRQLRARRAEVADALSALGGIALWNAGGSGSVESSAADPVVTEVTGGSGLLGPHLFDHYRGFRPEPAAFFGLRVVRRPRADVVTVAGGGLIASGPAGPDRSPRPWAPPGLRLTSMEGAGEVQTPLRGPSAGMLRHGDLVWFRHAKAGELAEHTAEVHLLQGAAIAKSVPTYRGLGHAW